MQTLMLRGGAAHIRVLLGLRTEAEWAGEDVTLPWPLALSPAQPGSVLRGTSVVRRELIRAHPVRVPCCLSCPFPLITSLTGLHQCEVWWTLLAYQHRA